MPWSMPRDPELRACRMRLMIERLGIDKAALVRAGNGEVVDTAFKRCLDCQTLDQCLPWLAGDATDTGPDAFCPNHATFQAIDRR